MGQEISSTSFGDNEEQIFRQKLREETKILKRWFDQGLLDHGPRKCGLELEAWLVTNDFIPAPFSDKFIDGLTHPLAVPEISKFNFELNSDPYIFDKKVFSLLEEKTQTLWEKCEHQAEKMNLKALMIGTLPTLRDYMLTMDHLSPQKRYFALNERIMHLKNGAPMIIDIEGKDSIHLKLNDVLTECAATSLQIHFGVNQKEAPRYYNASVIASSFIAAIGANSPFFYGKELWDETRVTIFEQSVNLKSFRKKSGQFATRVGLGNGYVHDSLMELFLENLDGYPVLLPEVMNSDPEWLDHLRLQNGTIWRWNRPLVGLSKLGRPNLRLEFRVPSAGPTIRDAISNMAMQIGLVEYFSQIDDLENKLSFDLAHSNFYQACKFGFDASVHWVDDKVHNIQNLLLSEIIPRVKDALSEQGIDDSDILKYIGQTIWPRVQSGQNGALWQKGFVHTHGPKFQEMLELYYQFQRKNIPIHEWSL